jgi:hypothetical protein
MTASFIKERPVPLMIVAPEITTTFCACTFTIGQMLTVIMSRIMTETVFIKYSPHTNVKSRPLKLISALRRRSITNLASSLAACSDNNPLNFIVRGEPNASSRLTACG